MRTFLSNMLSLAVGNVFTLAANFVFALVLIARLTDGEYGLQGAVVAFTNIVMAVAYLGLFNLNIRELTKREPGAQHDTYSSFFSLGLLLATLTCLIAVIIAALLNSFPGPRFLVLVLAMFVMVLSYAPIAPTEALLIVRERTWRMAVLQSFYALCTCILAIAILTARSDGIATLFSSLPHFSPPFTGGEFKKLSSLYVALSVLSMVTIGLYMREARQMVPGGPRLVFRPRQWLGYIREALPGGLGGSFLMLTRSIGTYLVFAFVSDASAGYLYLSYTLYQAVTQIVWVPYAVSILPVMTRLYHDAQGQLRWLIGRSVTWLLAITLPIALGGTLLATDILHVLAPSKIEAAQTLQIFVWLVPFAVLVEYFFRLQLVSSRQRTYVMATGVGALTNIALCLALIPGYGAPGAALGTVMGMATSALISALALRGWLHASFHRNDLLVLVAALASMALTVEATAKLSVFVRIGLGALVYGLVTFGLGLFRLADWRTARALLGVVGDSAPSGS